MHHEFDDLVRRQVVIHAAVLCEFLQAGVDALVIFLDIMALAGNAQDLMGNGLVLGGVGGVFQAFVDVVAVMGDGFSALQGTFQLEDFFIKTGNQHGEPVFFLCLSGQPHFRIVELEQEEEGEDEEAAQDGDEHEPAQHAEGESLRLLVGDGVHRGKLPDAGENLGDNGPEGDAQGLLIDGFAGELGQREEQGVDKIVEEVRDMFNKRIGQGRTIEHIQPCAEQHDGRSRHRAGKQTGEGAEPEQEQQEDRRTEAHAETRKIPAEGMHFRFPG